MSRGLGKLEQRILAVFYETAIRLDVPALAEAIPGTSPRGLRRAVQRLERSGYLTATFQPDSHPQRWGGSTRVKLVSLAHPKVYIQDDNKFGGAAYSDSDNAYGYGGYVRHRYLDRGRKDWERLAQRGYTLLPGVRKTEVYEALGTIRHWQHEEGLQYRHYTNAWEHRHGRALDAQTLSMDRERERKSRWEEAQRLLDQARLRLASLIKAPDR